MLLRNREFQNGGFGRQIGRVTEVSHKAWLQGRIIRWSYEHLVLITFEEKKKPWSLLPKTASREPFVIKVTGRA